MTETPDNHWMLRAACRGKWDLFDSVEDYNGNDWYPAEQEAKRICNTVCPVKAECDAAGVNESTNIWAGEARK